MITPKPQSVAAEIARRSIAHVTDPRVTVALQADVVAGLLAAIDDLAELRAAGIEQEGGVT